MHLCAGFLQHGQQIAAGQHVFDDIATTDEFTLDEQLRVGGEIGKCRQALIDERSFQYVAIGEADARG